MPKRKIAGWDSSSDEEEVVFLKETSFSCSNEKSPSPTNLVEISPQKKRQRMIPSLETGSSTIARKTTKGTKVKGGDLSIPEPRKIMWHVFVFVRGDITQRVYQIWVENFKGKLADLGIVLTRDYSNQINAIVVAKTVGATTVTSWLLQKGLQKTNIPIINSQWIVDIISSKCLLPEDSYRFLITTDKDNVLQSTQLDTLPTIELSTQLNDESSLATIGLYAQPSSSLPSVDLTTRRAQSSSNLPLKRDQSQQQPSSQTAYPMFANHYSGYACMRTGEVQKNHNKHITDILEDLQSIYELINDSWRAKGYKTCVGILKQLPLITHIDQVKNVRGIGESIREKIEEILSTGSLKKLSYFKNDPKIAAITELAKIWGVGEKTAIKFIKQGYRSVADLRARGHDVLNPQQRIGLKHYEEFMVKIPRAEIEELLSTVRSCVWSIVPDALCMVCGSYRRGKPASGDMDVIIAPPEGVEELPESILCTVIDKLSEIGFLTDHLALPYQSSDPMSPSKINKTATSSINGTRLGQQIGAASPLRTADVSSLVEDFSLTRTSTMNDDRNNGSVRAKIRSFPMIRQGSSSIIQDTMQDDIVSDDPNKNSSIMNNSSQLSPQSYATLQRQYSGSQTQQEIVGSTIFPTYVDGSGAHPFRSKSSYMGVCKLPGPDRLHRRIDIKVYPRSLLPFATLYFTGSDHFNRSMRLYAKRRGFHLSDKGLYYQQRIPYFAPKIPYRIGEYISCQSEEDIFTVLGLPYKTPMERNVFDNDHLFKDDFSNDTAVYVEIDNEENEAAELSKANKGLMLPPSANSQPGIVNSSSADSWRFRLRDGDSDSE